MPRYSGWLVLAVLCGCGGDGGSADRSPVPTATTVATATASSTATPTPAPTASPSGPVAFAVSQRQVLRSDDGGLTWAIIMTADESVQLRAVTLADRSHAWVVGGSDFGFGTALLHTRDGGRTWVDQLPNITGLTGGPTTNYGFFDVSFTTTAHGVAVGSDDQHVAIFAPPALAIVTDDGGASWRVADVTGPRRLGTLRSVCLNPSGTGIAVGHPYHESGIVWTTVDGGTIWEDIGSRDGLYGDFTSFTGAACADPDSFWIAGTNYGPSPSGFYPTILYRPSIGAAWFDRTPLVAIDSGEAAPITFVDAVAGWMISNRVIHRTESAGITWNRSRLPGAADAAYYAVSFRNREHGIVVGGEPTAAGALVTFDGGVTWREGSFPAGTLPLPLVDVAIAP